MNRIVLVLASAAPLTTPACLGPVCVPFPVGVCCSFLALTDSSCSAFPLLPEAHPSDNQVDLSAKWQLTPCSATVTSSQRAAAD